MKKRTWIMIALMYAAVFLACFGVLHIMDQIMEPGGPGIAESSGTPGNGSPSEAVPAESRPIATPSEPALPQAEEDWKPVDHGYEGWKQQIAGAWTPPEETPEPYRPPRLVLATDLHYQSADADDGGKAFQEFVEHSDGKVVRYLPELLEAFLDEVIAERPSALVLSGDITMNGEKINHQELAQRLKRVQDAGIQVLIIPGNHDINNHDASVFFGDARTPAETVDAREFYEIYREYGYDQAFSRDENSLSYAYALDERNWMLMLDSAQYDPVNRVEGRLKESTLAWMDGILAQAQEQGVFVLPVAHHNLLYQSRMYTTQCAMENNTEVIDLFQKYRLPLFFSGHLHVQRIRKHKAEPGVPDEDYGILEIVTDALSIPPCQYGFLEWKEDGSLEYATRAVDVSAWARAHGVENEDLLHFPDWSYQYIQKLISDQIGGVIRNLGDDIMKSMSGVYARVYMDYYAGRKIDQKAVRSSLGYQWWERNLPDSYLLREIEAMMADSDRDNNYYLWEGEP